MSPTAEETRKWFGFEDRKRVMRAFYDLFKVEPTYRSDFIWVPEAIENEEGELVLRNRRSWSVEATIAALGVIKNKGEVARTDEEAIHFAYDVNEGNLVIEHVLYKNMEKNRRGKKKGSQY